ncbi:pilus assembly protein [Thalassotalea sp. PS06]|nr:TadE family protein [Thalassotalea sp. PS06]QDP03007.1 pilus assembly protein [Thalassotalea sp. PS06]
MVILFLTIEVGRLMYTWNMLTEVTRRGARLATVCNALTNTSNTNTVAQQTGLSTTATFSGTDLLPNLTASNIIINYLDSAGNITTNAEQVAAVQTQITNYQHRFIVPFFSVTLNSPALTTDIPRESLGFTRSGITSC